MATKHHTEISRRNFLKTGVLATGALAVPSLTKGKDSVHGPSLPDRIDREVVSCCQFCQARCTTLVQVKDNRVINIYGNPESEWTGGKMCPKGQSMVELTYHPDRLLHSLLRRGNAWEKIPYRQAVEIAAEKIMKVKKDFPDDYHHRVALFAPLWESREGELAANMTFRMAGFPDFSHSGDTCIINAGVALDACLGSMVAETTHDELPNAELILLFGANIAELYPTSIRWLQKAREQGAKLVYIDPRRTPTGAQCDTVLRPRPGTDGALVMGILNDLISQNRYDKKFVKEHVNGFDLVAEPVKAYSLDKVAQITRLRQDEIQNLCEMVARSRRTIAWISGAISRYTNAIQTSRAIIAMQAITGNLAGPGKGILHFQSGKPASPPALNLDTPAIARLPDKRCVEDTAFMRANHMKLLNTWRDEAVREGRQIYTAQDGRTFEKSLTGTCIKCHSNKEQFCDRCHNYVGSKPTCFDCHVVPGEVKP